MSKTLVSDYLMALVGLGMLFWGGSAMANVLFGGAVESWAKPPLIVAGIGILAGGSGLLVGGIRGIRSRRR